MSPFHYSVPRTVGIVGLGYVGLPLAMAFAEEYRVVGYDQNEDRILTLQSGLDYTGEMQREELQSVRIEFSTDPQTLGQCDVIIVAVPTPIDEARQPDLSPLRKASVTVGRHMRRGTVIVYESTVYPGVTEEVCMPILENESGLKAGDDFLVGYSPERVNPGDKKHTFKQITKVVSGQNEEALSIIADIYGTVVEKGVYRAASIKVAEAAKVIENTQRDLNIALMNELAIIFDRMKLDTSDVLEAAGTKWNFVHFTPGLVGGHCIGVDPYYLTYKAGILGYHPEIISAGRRINDSMGEFVARSLVKCMIQQGIQIQGSLVTILGLTFKENVRDIRNSKVVDIIRELHDYGVRVQVSDPLADPDHVRTEYGLEVVPLDALTPADAVIEAVPHRIFIESGWELVKRLIKGPKGVVADIKGFLPRNDCPEHTILWRL
jgi:UDP-N-acetyl-D-glucosamine/UDP-N-acetyl-D-galactosamine dehydrogenase